MVPVHDQEPGTRVAEASQGGDDPRVGLAPVVVAEPQVEEIAQYVERARGPRLEVEERDESLDDVRPLPAQVNVGYEERGHGSAAVGSGLRQLRRTGRLPRNPAR